MRFLRLVLLPILLLGLLGADCEFRGGVNTRPPDPDRPDESPDPPDGGLLIGIQAGVTEAQPAASSELGGSRELVQAALAASVISTSTASSTAVAAPATRIDWQSVDAMPAPASLALEAPLEAGSSPVPEPGARALFAAGLGIVAEGLLRSHRRRGRRSRPVQAGMRSDRRDLER